MVIETIEGRRPEKAVVDLGFTVMERQSSARQPAPQLSPQGSRVDAK
jgi:hypothetical protein